MYLSKLEIFGFKSFAQKTSLKFTDGISCVIGPNGSGKSNIVDAIRWVLGEQKTTQLRTDRMENLIFNGTNVRKPLGMTEVSLTVNNNKNILKSEFTDVVISRRLYRSGESHYLINKTPCRLKDIVDLFMDTGMGANSYSVIELSMVESIISENPSERRHLFEEAAGVTKYKARRKSALRKLELTQQDMSRIADLIAEIQRNVNGLSRQVGKARRYLAYKDELRQKEIDLGKYRYMHYMDELRPLQQQLQEISLIKEDTSHQITLEEALLEDYRREIMLIETQIQEYNIKLQTQDDRIHQIKEDEAVAEIRIQAIMDTIARNERDIADYKLKIGEIKNLRSKNLEEKVLLESRISENSEKFHSTENQKKQAEAELKKSQEDLNHLREQLSQKSVIFSDLKEKRQEKLYMIQARNEQLSEIDNQQKQDEELVAELNEQSKRKISEKNIQSRDLQKIEKEIEKNQNLLNQSEKEQSTHDNLEKQTSAKLEAEQSRYQFFKHVIENYEGHQKGTQFIMSQRSKFPGILGPLADRIDVDLKYQPAVESALGDSVNYIVVDSHKTALEIIENVKLNKEGRFTIMCLDSVSDIKSPEVKAPPGFELLRNYISCEPAYNKVFDILLGDVVVVNSIKDALKSFNKDSSYRYITLSGELVDQHASISMGGNENKETGLIGRANRLSDIEKNISDLKKNLDHIADQKSETESKILAFNKNLENLFVKKKDLETRFSALDRENTELLIRIGSIESARAQRQTARDLILNQTTNAMKELTVLEKNLEKIEADFEIIQKNFTQSEQQLADLQERHLSEIDEYQTIQINYIQEENSLRNIEAAILRNDQSLDELHEAIEGRESENLSLNEELAKIEKNKIDSRNSKESIWAERDKIENEKEGIQHKYHELRDKILNFENQIKKYRKQHDSSLERSKQLELQIHEINMNAENLLSRIREEHGEEIDVGIGFEGLDVQGYEDRIQSLKFKINQLGQVNPLAVAEYEKENERLEFYTKQYNDLEEAVKSLQKTITKINVTARKQFMNIFNQIKENFERVFTSFFVNGEGTLSLDVNNDPLESNIEIMVRPKGRRVQTISLLSGGEKTLTAISLLFAIYLVKPSPFCILDEIDAPLDDVNISRFTSALKDFSKETQFIVVTHNKRTMEAADTMYGVTMEEEGLSKLVSVKFN